MPTETRMWVARGQRERAVSVGRRRISSGRLAELADRDLVWRRTDSVVLAGEGIVVGKGLTPIRRGDLEVEDVLHRHGFPLVHHR